MPELRERKNNRVPLASTSKGGTSKAVRRERENRAHFDCTISTTPPLVLTGISTPMLAVWWGYRSEGQRVRLRYVPCAAFLLLWKVFALWYWLLHADQLCTWLKLVWRVFPNMQQEAFTVCSLCGQCVKWSTVYRLPYECSSLSRELSRERREGRRRRRRS